MSSPSPCLFHSLISIVIVTSPPVHVRFEFVRDAGGRRGGAASMGIPAAVMTLARGGKAAAAAKATAPAESRVAGLRRCACACACVLVRVCDSSWSSVVLPDPPPLACYTYHCFHTVHIEVKEDADHWPRLHLSYYTSLLYSPFVSRCSLTRPSGPGHPASNTFSLPPLPLHGPTSRPLHLLYVSAKQGCSLPIPRHIHATIDDLRPWCSLLKLQNILSSSPSKKGRKASSPYVTALTPSVLPHATSSLPHALGTVALEPLPDRARWSIA